MQPVQPQRYPHPNQFFYNKVRRGEFRCALPTGFVYDEAGEVVLDPDSQVRETIAYFFESTFSIVGE